MSITHHSLSVVEKPDRTEALRRTALFGNLPQDLLEKIASLAVNKSVPGDQILASEHQQASGIYIIVQGEFRSIRQTREGREQVLSTERAGAIIGLVPVFNSGKFYSTMIADADSEVLFIKSADLHELCRQHPEILWNLARVLADRVRHMAELVESLALRNVEQRLAQYFLTVGWERGARVGAGCVYELSLTRSEIASRIGSVREVVSRACSQLVKRGLIHIKGRRLVTIPDMSALGKFAGTEPELEECKMASEVPSDIA
jgi:CRP/FNR family cyclic AMP-dependent transcriptional regulator